MKTGLVLEGGAMRGMYTAGVMDVFLDHQIEFDGIVGVSAGALFGVNLLSKQKGRVIRYNKRFNSDKNYLGLHPLLKEGNIVSTDYAYNKVPKYLDPFDNDTYKKSNTDFYAVVTNIDTGEPEYILVKDVFEQMDALRASGSMPFVSKPVQINDQYYLDGGISDSIPFEWLSKQGYDKIVVVLTRDMDYHKKPMSQALISMFYHHKTHLKDTLVQRHEIYNSSVNLLKQWEQEGKAYVIRPSTPIEINRIESDPDKLEEVYELGLQDANQSLESLIKYMR